MGKMVNRVGVGAIILLLMLLSGPSVLAGKGDVPKSYGKSFSMPGKSKGTLNLSKETNNRYIVQLSDPPLALYEGGLDGLKATSPKATGLGKIDTSSAASQDYMKHLVSRQDAVLSTIGRALGNSPRVYKRYQVVFNGYCLELSSSQAKKVAGLEGVKSVLPDFKRKALTDAGPQWIGAPDVWNGVGGITVTKGEGIVVGIIDSGINPLNPSFADVGGDGFDHTNPRGQLYGVCNAGHPFYDPTFPCNDKLIGAYDFARDDGDPYNAIDDDGHGSHTAGTTAGNVTTATLPVNSAPSDPLVRQISGVAPHANIISYRGLQEGSGWTSWLVAAIEQAIVDQVDVINYSIGGPASDPWAMPDTLVFLIARVLGVFVAVSAGNDGPVAGSLGGPADAPWVLSVGSSSHDRSIISRLTDLTATGNSALSDIEGMGITGAYGPTEIVYAGDYPNPNDPDGDPGLCDEAFPAATFSGRIVVCDRGDAHMEARLAKGANVLAGGAGGMVLANGSDMTDSLTAMNHDLPAVNITYQDGLALKNWLGTGSNHMAAISAYSVVENDTARADIVAAYSSRGPNPTVPNVIKPDVAAPGQNIYAPYGENGAVAWNVLIGTSMASPHAAGAGALLKAARPGLTPAEIQSALTTTARTNLLKDDSSTAADPFDMGGGRIDVARAAKAALVLDEAPVNYLAVDPYFDGDPSTLNLASMGKENAVWTHTWTRTLKSTLGQDSTWTAAVTNPAGVALSVSPNTFTLPGGATQTVQITADLSQAPLDQWLFGQVAFNSSGQVSAALPVAVKQVISDLDSEMTFSQVPMRGSAAVEMTSALDITDFTAVVSGMAPGEVNTGRIYQDPTPDDPFDDLTPQGGVMVVEKTVAEGMSRLVAQIGDTTSPDIDLFVVNLDTGYVVCVSASYSSDEYCNIDSPSAGNYWVIAQNWQATDTTGQTPDSVEVVVAAVPDTDSGHLDVTARSQGVVRQTAIPAGQSFDLLLEWYLGDAGQYWYGGFTVGTDSANPANLGQVNVDIVHNNRKGSGGTGGSGCFIQTTR